MKKRTATKKKKFNPICLPINSLFLNISNTDATSLSFLKRFEKLTSINATDTLISDLKDVQISESIIDIKLKGTPFSKNQFYRIMLLIGLSPQIQIIDDDDITKDERDLAEALQNTTLLFIYQGYLITNLDPLTLLLNNKKEPNNQPIIIPTNQIVIGPHQTLSEVKARQTFAMIEDLSNEIQKTAFDLNLKTIQKNEVGNLLKQIKKVNTNNKKGAKKIQNQQSKETVTKEVPVQKTQSDDSEYYLSLITKMNYVNTTSVKPIEPPKEVKPVEEETPTKSPKLTRTELKQLIREKRKQNSSLIDSPVQKSPQKIEIPAPQETNPVEKKKKKKTIKVIKVKHITKNEQANTQNDSNEPKTPLKRSASAMKPKESPKTHNDIQQIKKNVSTPENKSPKGNYKPRSASATPTRPTKESPPISKENLNSSKKTTTNKKTPIKTENKTSNSINKSPKHNENSPKSKNEKTLNTKKSNSISPKQNKTNEDKDLITKEESPIKLKKTADKSNNSTRIQKNKISKDNIKEEPTRPNNSNEIESIKINSIQSPLGSFPKENNFTPPHNLQKTSNSMISTPNLNAMSLWDKPATPIVSIMKTSKQTTPQEKKSVRFSFNKSFDNDQNMTNESVNDEITSLTFLENNASNDELFTSPKPIKDKFSSLRIQNKNKQKEKEDRPVSMENAIQSNVTNQTNKFGKSNKSNQKVDNNSNQTVDTKSNQKVDNNFNQNDIIDTRNDGSVINQNKEEEDDISQAELEYEKWKQQQKEMQQQTVKNNFKDFLLDEVPDEDSSSTQIRKRYGSIYAAFSDESSSELPPEYSTAFHSFSKEMSFHKESDSENKNLNSDVLFNSPIHKQIDQTVGYSPDAKTEPNLLLLDNNEGTISENLLNSDIESSDAFMSSSSTESSGHRSHMKRDKLKAMREKNMKKKQEIERKKNAERMQSLVESLDSLSEPEPHFNESEKQEIESNSKEQTNNDESEDSIGKIRNESRKRQQRLANGGSLFSSSFGINSISESETIHQESSFHEGKEQNENDDSVIKDIELPVNKENKKSELNNSSNEVHQITEIKKELDQPPNQTIQTINQEVDLSNESQINNQEESETITKEQEQISNQNNQDENEEILTKEIGSISNQNNNQEEIDVNLRISKEDESDSPKDQNSQEVEVDTKQSNDIIQSPITNPTINETVITTNKEEQILENKTEVKPSKPKTTKKKIITKRKIVKGGQNKTSKPQNNSEPKETEFEPPKEEMKMIYRFKLETIPNEIDKEENNGNTEKETANPIDLDNKPLNDKQSTETMNKSIIQPENKKRKILQITNTLDLDISKNAQNIPNSPPVQTNLNKKQRSPSLPVKSIKQSDLPNSGKGSPPKSHIPVPSRSHSPIPKPPIPPKPILLKKSLIPTRNSKAKKLFDPSLLINETKKLNQENNTTEIKSNTEKKNTSFEEPKVRESQIKLNDELSEEDDQSYLDTPIAKKKKRKNSKGAVVYTSIVHKKSDDIDETKENDDQFLNFEPLSSKELFKNNFAVDDNDIRQILDNHLPSSAEPIFTLNSSREDFSENEEINEPPSSSKPLNEISDDDDSSIINYSISEAIKDFPHQNITQIKSDLDVRLTEYELHENNSINKQNSLDTVLINFDKENQTPEVNGNYKTEKKAKNKIAQEKKTDEINDNFSNEKNIDIPNKFVQGKKPNEIVINEKKSHKVKDTFGNEKKANNKIVQEIKTAQNLDDEKEIKTHKVNNTVINEKKTDNNFVNEDNQTKTKNKTDVLYQSKDKLIPEDKESYNKSDFFLTEDDHSLPIIKDIENDEMESTPTIKNDGLFDSDNPNDLFLLQFSLINEEEDEIEQTKTPTPHKKTIKKRKHSKGKRSSAQNSGESSPRQSLSPRSRAKYDDEQLEKILQLKPKVPVQGGSGLSSPTTNKNPFSITPNNSSHDQLNLIDVESEKDEKTFTISSENKHSDDLNDIFFKPDKVHSPDGNKTDLLLLNQENEIKLDLLTNNENNFLTKNSKKNGKLDFPFPGKISINQDSLYENLLHMPSESAQIDEFLELEEIVKLDSNFVLSSSEIPKKVELIKQRENNSVPEESKVSPIKPLPIHDIKLYDEMLMLPSESENGETVRKRRRNRKESNKNDEFDVPKRAFSFDEYDDLPTYLSENEDESGDENNEVNLPKPNIEKNSLFNPNFVFQSDSDSTSEFFKNQNKGKTGS